MSKVRPLSNKPLVEAILEIKWEIPQEAGDPRYSLFVGRLYDRVQSDYPFHQELPASMMPPPVSNNLVQHRFRIAEEKWPLVQIGPGIVTLNDTENYIWSDFGDRAKRFVDAIYKAYPNTDLFKVTHINLRYIDAFDLEDENMMIFLEEKLKTKILIPSALFENNNVNSSPYSMGLNVMFTSNSPSANIQVKFNSGKHKELPAIIMELGVYSNSQDVPNMPSEFSDWIESSHNLSDEWFFTFIEGELERKYSGE